MMSENKKTLVIGASENPSRYAFIAANRLLQYGHDIVLLGNRKGMINGHPIETGTPPFQDVHTITLYMRAELQKPLYQYFLALKPKRIIFNPGTENRELEKLAEQQGIETTEACTLVMLSVGTY